MKRQILILTIAAIAICSCKKEEPNQPVKDGITEVSIDATSRTMWHYYSFADNKIVGTGAENAENNTKWFARKDWDIALSRYHIRTNSGEATTADAKGGVYILDAKVTFESLTALPANVSFASDKSVTERGMGGVTTIIKSGATSIIFKKNDDGSLVMPPVYLPAPICVFRSADGTKTYKTQFLKYVNDEGVAGHVKFKFIEIK